MSAERWQERHLSRLNFPHYTEIHKVRSRASITSGRRVGHSLKPG